jgi:DNA-binding NarL/FixJ family response regulator
MADTTPGNRPVRVLVADDEAMVRAGVRAIMSRLHLVEGTVKAHVSAVLARR